MILTRIESYLRDREVPYVIRRHPPAFTAQEVAEAEHVSGWQVVKTVAVELGSGEEIICAVPAPTLVDFDAVDDATGSRDSQLCEEGRLRELFPGCEAGAAPPLGGLWNLPVIFDPALRAIDRILVQGGTHDTLIELSTEDFLHLERPRLASIAALPGEPWKHAESAAGFHQH